MLGAEGEGMAGGRRARGEIQAEGVGCIPEGQVSWIAGDSRMIVMDR